jgi:hypothetical protein
LCGDAGRELARRRTEALGTYVAARRQANLPVNGTLAFGNQVRGEGAVALPISETGVGTAAETKLTASPPLLPPLLPRQPPATTIDEHADVMAGLLAQAGALGARTGLGLTSALRALITQAEEKHEDAQRALFGDEAHDVVEHAEQWTHFRWWPDDDDEAKERAGDVPETWRHDVKATYGGRLPAWLAERASERAHVTAKWMTEIDTMDEAQQVFTRLTSAPKPYYGQGLVCAKMSTARRCAELKRKPLLCVYMRDFRCTKAVLAAKAEWLPRESRAFARCLLQTHSQTVRQSDTVPLALIGVLGEIGERLQWRFKLDFYTRMQIHSDNCAGLDEYVL